MTLAIVWFRRDLRLADNPALVAACAAHKQVLPVYLHTPAEEGGWPPGAASRWWLHHSLLCLSHAWRRRGGELFVHQSAGDSDSLAILLDLLKRTGARAVYWNRLYEPATIARDTRIKAVLREHAVEAHSCRGSVWNEPWQLATQEGKPYRVFTPYWRKLRPQLGMGTPLPIPAPLHATTASGGVTVQALGLLPRVSWDTGLRETWAPGEQGAHEQLELFADDAIGDYQHARDRPARHGTSRLSPHLHFGEITPTQIQHALQTMAPRRAAENRLSFGRPDLEPYLRELGWREFAHHLLYHFPQTPTEPFDARFAKFPWAPAHARRLRRWQQGRTGIPLVDAGMRELWQTGWMHNRVRMVAASFLTKNLRMHWRHGAAWFWNTLVDADLANNTLGWQWVAGCGADAAPYFRVFNPLTQAKKFDPDGTYLRRWLPELADAPLELLHEPWKDAALLKRGGYPAPMVDLGQSRQAALAAYQVIRL